MLNARRSGRCARPAASRQRGVGLVEVLIAVLVLSIGMLGMAGLQSWSLRNNQSSMERGMAVVHAYQIADIMRADRANAINGDFDIGIEDAAPADADYISLAIADWRASMQQTLGPDASGSIDCNGALCDIVVRWNDARGTEGAAEQEITIEVEL